MHYALVQEVEKAIGEYGRKAKDGTLALEEMAGGTALSTLSAPYITSLAQFLLLDITTSLLFFYLSITHTLTHIHATIATLLCRHVYDIQWRRFRLSVRHSHH